MNFHPSNMTILVYARSTFLGLKGENNILAKIVLQSREKPHILLYARITLLDENYLSKINQELSEFWTTRITARKVILVGKRRESLTLIHENCNFFLSDRRELTCSPLEICISNSWRELSNKYIFPTEIRIRALCWWWDNDIWPLCQKSSFFSLALQLGWMIKLGKWLFWWLVQPENCYFSPCRDWPCCGSTYLKLFEKSEKGSFASLWLELKLISSTKSILARWRLEVGPERQKIAEHWLELKFNLFIKLFCQSVNMYIDHQCKCCN